MVTLSLGEKPGSVLAKTTGFSVQKWLSLSQVRLSQNLARDSFLTEPVLTQCEPINHNSFRANLQGRFCEQSRRHQAQPCFPVLSRPSMQDIIGNVYNVRLLLFYVVYRLARKTADCLATTEETMGTFSHQMYNNYIQKHCLNMILSITSINFDDIFIVYFNRHVRLPPFS